MALPIKLKLPEDFLKEEVRCGYKVTTKLKKIWAVELDLLNELKRVCDKHGIKFCVFGGTLLGAVRHKGFIPWDDDLDVSLTRENFDKLCKVAKDEFKHPYFFQTALSDRRYFFSYARLRNSETTAVINGNESPNYNNGIYIDVYVLEGYTDSRIKWYIQRCFQLIFVKFMTLYYQDKRRNNSFREMMLRIPRPFVRLFKYETLFALYKKVLGMYTTNANRIGLRDEMSVMAEKYWVYKRELLLTDFMQFEFLSVPVPKAYHEILGRIYGDYQQFPNVDVRGLWHNGQIYFDPDIPYRVHFEYGKSI